MLWYNKALSEMVFIVGTFDSVLALELFLKTDANEHQWKKAFEFG